jgi:hypothetical protein
MASNTKQLTLRQEKFIQNILKGNTRYDAYVSAYPKALKWDRNIVDITAYNLLKTHKIFIRYTELLEQLREKEHTKICWTRDEAIKTLLFILEQGKKEINEMIESKEMELDLIYRKLEKNTKDLDMTKLLTEELISKLKQSRITSKMNNVLLGALDKLNKLYGFYTFNIQVSREYDPEKEAMKSLTTEELRTLVRELENKIS